MSWIPRAKGGATWYVCDYLISWFMLIVWFHQSLKWWKLICSLQILSVSRRVIRIEALTMMTPRPGTGSGWRCFTSSGYWHHHQVIAMGGYSALMVMVPQWYYTYIHIPPRQCPLSNYDMLPLQPGTWGQLQCAVKTYVRPHSLLLLLFHPIEMFSMLCILNILLM